MLECIFFQCTNRKENQLLAMKQIENYYQEVIERINQDILLDFVISNIFVNDRVKIKLYLCTSKFCDIEFIRVFVIKRNI